MSFENFISAILPSLCVSIIMLIFNYHQAKRDKQSAEREKKRRLNEQIQVTLLVATAKLCLAAALSIKNHDPTPDLDEKTVKLEEAMEKFKNFERELVADARIDM